ncbi:unnamed protein product [Owenia fusiformis]|uniref:Uncharacterized protein n=1 Tax=Owenia fusiformis TaxID=6347 RepID=A0A8S4NQX7_OWEFU|nr:unnamed protein product [Owenia fusiformis]
MKTVVCKLNVFLFLCTAVVLMLMSMMVLLHKGSLTISRTQRGYTYSAWSSFVTADKYTKEEYKNMCFNKFATPSIGVLYDMVEEWKISTHPVCRQYLAIFNTIFTVRKRSGSLNIPDTFVPKMLKWLGGNKKYLEEAQHQTITITFNELTRDSTIFNPLRGKRPITKPEISERLYVDNLAEKSGKTCDFCESTYKKYTGIDPFGRLETSHAFTASNAFKYDAWHTMVVFRNHHPLDWNFIEFMDLFQLTLDWVNKVHYTDPNYKYPIVMWDLLPHASASQIHPHVHVTMETDRYYGSQENWRLAAEQYSKMFPDRNYFTDLIHLHDILGLAVHVDDVVAYASITPKKDNEIVIMAESPSANFFHMIYYVTRAFIEDMDHLCYSMSIVYPEMGSSNTGRMPTLARIVTRGSVSEIRSDISSLELFAASNVNVDPFKAIQFIRKSIKHRKHLVKTS